MTAVTSRQTRAARSGHARDMRVLQVLLLAAGLAGAAAAPPPEQPGWHLAHDLLPSLAFVHPLKGDYQGGTSVSVFGAGFAFNGVDTSNMRCCWDHHPGYEKSQVIYSPTSFPERSISLIKGGDGVIDVESAVEHVNDSVVVCPSYESIPGYTHTDDLLISFQPNCQAGALLDTFGDFTFHLDWNLIVMKDVVPWGGPILGGTNVTIRGRDFGGRKIRCRFWTEFADATYVDRTTLRCQPRAIRSP